jgi:hypothetical protein
LEGRGGDVFGKKEGASGRNRQTPHITLNEKKFKVLLQNA